MKLSTIENSNVWSLFRKIINLAYGLKRLMLRKCYFYYIFFSITGDEKINVCFLNLIFFKKNGVFLFFLLSVPLLSQELSGPWTGTGTSWIASACDIDISTSVSNLQNGASVSFSTGFIECNMANTYSSNLILNQPAIAPFLDFGTNGKGVLSFTFSKAVKNPILHIDRLGGGYFPGPRSNSALITLITPGLSLTKLSGNGPHFAITPTTITRTPDELFGTTTTPECGLPTVGGSAGSVRVEGIVTTISFEYELNGAVGNADAIEVIWELVCDFDLDDVPDSTDLDDDNDGILDTIELNGNPLLDTDGDGFIDSMDLDSDDDGCSDVVEAGFTDPDMNGSLGLLPDTVNSEGLIIDEPDGYTTPADINSNGIFDFQENNLPVILIQPEDLAVCEGENAIFSVSIQNLNTIQWQLSTDSGITWLDISDSGIYQGVQTENLEILNVSTVFNSYMFRAKYFFCDEVLFSETVTLSVFEKPNAGIDGTAIFCPNDTPENLLNFLEGNPDPTGVWTPFLSQGNGVFDPQFDAEGTYTYTLDNGYCGLIQSTVLVQFSNIAVITDIIVTDFSTNNSINVQVQGLGDYEFSIDGLNYQDDNLFNNLPGGTYTVSVRDKNGCGIETRKVDVLNYPKFFTPNNDGFNDYWNIKGFSDTIFTVYIFDRYGKLLKTINDNNKGWDGKYNNLDMQASDYWFRYIDSEGRLVSGHFSLRR